MDTHLINLLEQVFSEQAHADGIGPAGIASLAATAAPIFDAVINRRGAHPGLGVIGICGAQGSGKTTITAGLAKALRRTGLSVATLSIDDFYLSRRQRGELAARVHPLLRTRGVPGTHEIERAEILLEHLGAAKGQPIPLPKFDKSRDDRVPASEEPMFRGPADLVLIEGWCVGATVQPEAALAEPINALERIEDSDARWRRYVNTQLSGPYQRLFRRLDLLALLKAPSYECVHAWRAEQESKLAASVVASGRSVETSSVMSAAALDRFMMHYERLTRHILAEMPARADIVVEFDEERRPVRVFDRARAAAS